jgi:uncharacterized protein (TIGR00251 family)
MTPLEVQVHPETGTITLLVRVQPRARKNEVVSVLDGALRIRLQAPAVEDRANHALRVFLAELLKRPKSAVRILSGERSRTKRIELFGVTVAEVDALTKQDV